MKIEGTANVDSEKIKYDEDGLQKSGDGDMNLATARNSNKSSRKRKKLSPPKGRKYLLRSAGDGVRVLRSMVNTKSKSQSEPLTTPVNPVMKRKKRKKLKNTTTDEYLLARKRIRYLLNRMKYEQTLIDAYAGDGWKGQSAEKIRPERELERAKCEILQCKLKIRELFHHLDSLSSEGRFQESLFDSEGQISSDDIFCAKCGLKDLSADNDIILCDGVCDRGFHQKCLNPPLLSADIPIGDEGWLCPACDCKVDCIDLLNESQGSNLLIKNTWERVFPEAAAIENGNKQSDDLPSDDSEDFEFDPDRPEDVEGHEEESDHPEESDFTCSAENADASECPKQTENFGLPSDDSEDDNYDPDVSDPDKITQKDVSSSDESDFTSDSDDFCNELGKTSGANEDTASSLPKNERSAEDTNYSSLNSDVLSLLNRDLNKENILVSGKRLMKRLDYKQLYDETHGKSSSDSSEDEDWLETSEMGMPEQRKKAGVREGSHVLCKENAQNIKKQRSSRSDAGEFTKAEAESNLVNGQLQETHVDGEVTPMRRHSKLDYDTIKIGEQHPISHEPDSYVRKSSNSAPRRLGAIASQKLYESFQENQYPTREKKESLAQELGLMIRQVDKWFINTRHSYRVSAKEASQAENASPDKDSKSTEIGVSNSEKVVGQSSSTKGKGKKSAPTSELGAEHINKLAEGLSESSCPNESELSVRARKSKVIAENGSMRNDTSGRSTSSKESNEKKSVPASRFKAAAEHDNNNEENMKNAVDKDRQKAIERELRRMKKRR